MKSYFRMLVVLAILFAGGCGGENKGDQNASAKANASAEKKSDKIDAEVELSCGQ